MLLKTNTTLLFAALATAASAIPSSSTPRDSNLVLVESRVVTGGTFQLFAPRDNTLDLPKRAEGKCDRGHYADCSNTHQAWHTTCNSLRGIIESYGDSMLPGIRAVCYVVDQDTDRCCTQWTHDAPGGMYSEFLSGIDLLIDACNNDELISVQQRELKVLKARKRKRVELDPNSKFAGIRNVYRAQQGADNLESVTSDSSGLDLSSQAVSCIVVGGEMM
ncbi:hypothetical protein F4782DRAFT_503489 [Xylaria castorea]|nr:hypothetical protein F4782DRAFT_503489 [Xylaria castorea]